MVDVTRPDEFLRAEAEATRISADLERLLRTLQSYEASAKALDKSAAQLSAVAIEVASTVVAVKALAAELKRLGVEETQRRLDQVVETVGKGFGETLLAQTQNAQAIAANKDLLTSIRNLSFGVLALVAAGAVMVAWLFTSR